MARGGLLVQDASLEKTTKIAHRRFITTLLKQSLAFDLNISCYDACFSKNILVVCTRQTIFVFDLLELGLVRKMGREFATSVEFNSCHISKTGARLVTNATDGRIFVWNLKTGSCDKIIRQEKVFMYQVRFTEDGDHIYTSGDDGFIYLWNWPDGRLVKTTQLRHPAAVRCFEISPTQPDRMVVGRHDGGITTWDLPKMKVVDNIEHDPSWDPAMKRGNPLGGWSDAQKYHTGSILCMKRSSNGRFLATGSSDHTCKLWNVGSYRKDLAVVEVELSQSAKSEAELDRPIELSNLDYLDEYVEKNFGFVTEVPIGEVSLSAGFHGDLMFTYRHDAPVLAVDFNKDSDIVITGSADATCRLWSANRGLLLFQINTPGPVRQIMADLNNRVFASCYNRVLVFEIFATSKEEELPIYWQGQHDKMDKPADKPENQTLAAMIDTAELRSLTMDQMQRLTAHGRIRHSYLDTLLKQFSEINDGELRVNMSKFGLEADDLLNIIIKTPFAVKDILTVLGQNLARSDAIEAFQLLLQGESLTTYMLKKGFKPAGDHDESRLIRLAYHDVTSDMGISGRAIGLGNPKFTVTVFPEEAFNLDEEALYSLSGAEMDPSSMGVVGTRALFKPTNNATSQREQQQYEQQQRQALATPRIQARQVFQFAPKDFLAPPSEWTNAFAFRPNTKRRGVGGVRGPPARNALMQQPPKGNYQGGANGRMERFNEVETLRRAMWKFQRPKNTFVEQNSPERAESLARELNLIIGNGNRRNKRVNFVQSPKTLERRMSDVMFQVRALNVNFSPSLPKSYEKSQKQTNGPLQVAEYHKTLGAGFIVSKTEFMFHTPGISSQPVIMRGKNQQIMRKQIPVGKETTVRDLAIDTLAPS